MIELVLIIILVLLISLYIYVDYKFIRKGYDLNHFFKFLMFLLIFLGCLIFNAFDFIEAYDLHNNGIEAWALITDVKIEKKHSRRSGLQISNYHTLLYNDYKKNRVNLDKAYNKGDRIRVVYSIKNPENLKNIRKQNSALQYFISEKSIWSLIVPIVSFVAFLLSLNDFLKKK